MWAKGPMAGATPKADFLAKWPGAVCKREYYAHGITASVVRGTDGEIIAADGNAQKAWEKAMTVMLRRELQPTEKSRRLGRKR